MTKAQTVDWKALAADQLEFHWNVHFRPRIADLTDDEYFWEPVDGCWSVRHADDGTYMADYEVPNPDPAPVTTIAWRLAHITVGVFAGRNASHFGGPAIDYSNYTYPATAAEALRNLDEHHDRWVAGVAAMDEADLAQPVGPAEGVYADRPYAELVLHINRETMHHGAEILLLRDLWRNVSQSRHIG